MFNLALLVCKRTTLCVYFGLVGFGPLWVVFFNELSKTEYSGWWAYLINKCMSCDSNPMRICSNFKVVGCNIRGLKFKVVIDTNF